MFMYAAELRIRKPIRFRFAIIVLLVSATLTLAWLGFHALGGGSPKADLGFGNLSLTFVPNEGQADTLTRFVAHAPGGTLYFTPLGVSIAIPSSIPPSLTDRGRFVKEAVATGPRESAAGPDTFVQLQFLGTNSSPALTGDAPMLGKANYFLGNDSKQWRANLPTYAGVSYGGLYPGIDLKYSGRGGQLKGTYTVAPGADPGSIRWQYSGPGNPQISIDHKGTLQVQFASKGGKAATITEQAPLAWQEIGGQKVPVSASYVQATDGSVGFLLGSYDNNRLLTIDPTLQYSTYLGGVIADQAWDLATDAAGNAYVVGYTASSNFPTVNAVQPTYRGQGDAFVAKFDTNGVPVYITYLGGTYLDSGHDIAVDSVGNVYVTGWTGSTNFPIVNAFQPTYAGGWDAFVTKLNASGSAIIYSSYLGGSSQENATNAGTPGGIGVDGKGNAYITGNTQSTNFPVVNAYQPTRNGGNDAFVTKVSPSGSSLVYSTYLGGESTESAFGLAVDAAGNAYITGDTQSSYFPTANAFQPLCHRPSYVGCWDMFVTKLNASGNALVYSTYMGGDDLYSVERGHGIAVDNQGNAYVTGWTGSTNFPTQNAYQYYNAGQEDVSAAKFSPTGTLLYSSYLGGSNSDVGYDIAVNSAGNFYVTGLTLSNDYPTLNPIQPSLAGTEDAILTKFSADGPNLVYSTYFGGSNGREEWGATGIGLDGANNVYIAGHTAATNFPTLNAYRSTNAGSYDVFLSKFADTTLPLTPTPTSCGAQYTIQVSTQATIVPGAVDIGNHCASCVTPIDLPFPFTLYGRTYMNAYVGTNGTLRFQDEFIPFVNQCLPADQPQQTLLPYWDDLMTFGGPNSGVYTSISGSAPNRIFNIEWIAYHNSTTPAHFEIRLYENSPGGQFDFIYAETGTQGSSATVGVQEDRLGRYLQYSCNTPSLYQGLKLTFTHDTCVTGTPIVTPVATATPGSSALVGHATWQGRPTQPNTLQQLPITLTLKLGATEVNYPGQTTDASGFFTVPVGALAPGTYDWRAKGPQYLATSGTVILTNTPSIQVEIGLMRTGDANNDNAVNVTDFNILKVTFGKSFGDPGYDDRADFTGDQAVNVADFNLLKVNFGQGGVPPISPGGGQ